MSFTTQGLVLRATGVSENDRALSLLAFGRGRIRAWANGSRQMKSQIMPASQLFSYARFTVLERRGRYIITAAELIDSFYGLRRDIVTLSTASYLAELMAALTDEGVPCDDLMRAGLNALHLLARGGAPCELIKGAAEMRMMALSGYMPDLVGCGSCGRHDGPMSFDIAAAGLICHGCMGDTGDDDEGEQAGESVTQVSPGVLAALRHSIYAPAKKLYSFSLSDAALAQFAQVCEAYTLYTLGRGFNTLDFLHSL